MSQYKRDQGQHGDFNKPPTCDGCSRVMTTHRSRWHTLWLRPVLICADCRDLMDAKLLAAKLAHIRSLVAYETSAMEKTQTQKRSQQHTSVSAVLK